MPSNNPLLTLNTSLSYLYAKELASDSTGGSIKKDLTQEYMTHVSRYKEKGGKGFCDVAIKISGHDNKVLGDIFLNLHELKNEGDFDAEFIGRLDQLTAFSEDKNQDLEYGILLPHYHLYDALKAIRLAGCDIDYRVSIFTFLPLVRTTLAEGSCLPIVRHTLKYFMDSFDPSQGNDYSDSPMMFAIRSAGYYCTYMLTDETVAENHASLLERYTESLQYLLTCIYVTRYHGRDGSVDAGAPALLSYNPWTYNEDESVMLNEMLNTEPEEQLVDVSSDLLLSGNISINDALALFAD